MLPDNLKFVHLTDLHFSALGMDEPTLLNDTTVALRASFAAIRAMEVPPAFIAISGDLTDRGNEADYVVLKPLLEELAGDIPLVLAIGNHDRRDTFYEVFGGHDGGDRFKPHDHDRVIAGLHIITLDSSIPGMVGGELAASQIAWLKARLEDHAECRKLVMVHHSPLFDLERGDVWDRLDVASTEALREAIAGKNVVGILSGHVHMEEVTNWYGVPVIVGVGHHAATNPVAPADEVQLVEATGMTICPLRSQGLAATFVPHPQDRRVLRIIPKQRIVEHDQATRAARSASAVT